MENRATEASFLVIRRLIDRSSDIHIVIQVLHAFLDCHHFFLLARSPRLHILLDHLLFTALLVVDVLVLELLERKLVFQRFELSTFFALSVSVSIAHAELDAPNHVDVLRLEIHELVSNKRQRLHRFTL